MNDASVTPQQVLDLELPGNDAGAATVRDYLVALLAELWREEEGFSGKRPFGNSGWQSDIYDAMARAGYAAADPPDGDGCIYITWEARPAADALILAAIKALGEPATT